MAIFTDITKDNQKIYRVDTPGKYVFFARNRSDTIIFELMVPGAEAYIFFLFTGKKSDQHTLSVVQHHQTPDTVSRVLVKSVLSDASSFDYHGTIRIDQRAQHSDASQTNRNLILSREARASSKPELEILADDVTCRHAATTGAPDQETLHSMIARGLTPKQAKKLYATGFVAGLYEEIRGLGSFPELDDSVSL